MTSLSLSIPSLKNKATSSFSFSVFLSLWPNCLHNCWIVEQDFVYSLFQGESDDNEAVEEDKNDEGDHSDPDTPLNEGGKKDSFKRRQELLVDSGLAEVCTFMSLWKNITHCPLSVRAGTCFGVSLTSRII